MQNFDDAFMALIGNEGGYTNNPLDPGGATRWGITEAVARANGYEGAMQDLPLDTAKQIAKKKYWDVCRCDEMPVNVAFQVFDAVYNGGHAVTWLQNAVGVTADGVIGEETLAATRTCNTYRTIALFNSYRILYLTQLKTWSTFGKGWANRIAHNLTMGG